MNPVKSKTLHPHLRDEEAAVVENAVRLAVDSIINVLYGVNSARSREYQRMVADRDKEIRRLEGRLGEIDLELQLLRRQGCACGLYGAERGRAGSRSSGEPQDGEQSRTEPSQVEPERTAGPQDCEMSISLGFFARPPSHVSSQSRDSAPLSSPSRSGPDQSSNSFGSESSGPSEAAKNLPGSPPSALAIKEEPCEVDTVLIKWEMSEEKIGEHLGSTASSCPDKESPSEKKNLEEREKIKFRKKPHADPDGHLVTEEEHQRNKRRSVPMSELPEEAQRLKRAAWRAASRRYYARKVARQQANPSRSGPLTHVTDSCYAQPISFVDRRRKTLISELPVDSQTLQREAWRAASRRYYARKIARHQAEATQYAHLLHNMEPSEDTLGPNRGGPHSSSGGIMDCWEEEGGCRAWDFAEGGIATATLKRNQTRFLCELGKKKLDNPKDYPLQ
ncbi:hypothetical protein L3Q82_002465 [Scortum barcoo]|uniref:Uncharacterized protein n=1 Tax=Scortum barcoo TaxID=214431 RepID=A0ACB8VY00_9TELE|nr:hypothetical protein L3Q82_002465 [Scortum barcoo]